MIRNYLMNWMQRVKLDDVKSSWKCAVDCVPYGFQAGLCIFNIFLDDLFHFLEGLCRTTNYADDNSLTAIDHHNGSKIML